MTETTKTIGKYQILDQIGAGGFGAVFKGYDPFIKRPVAVKTCTTEDPDIRARFFNEAEIAGNLHHRNITTVYDFGVQDELPYLVQEYLSGEDLDRKIKREEPIPFPEKLHYLLQIARGLAYAHSQGIVHRDVKPANVRVLEDGTTKIMDFGIAKLAQQQSGLTQTGMTMGTAAYLAPEQIRGESADLRTDVFAFGTLAYELVTYERPFKGEHISALLFQILNHQPAPIHELRPDCPGEMIRIVGRCLEKEPSRRYASGGELLAALEVVQTKGRLEREVSSEHRPVPLHTPTPATPARLVNAAALGLPPPPPLPPTPSSTAPAERTVSLHVQPPAPTTMPLRTVAVATASHEVGNHDLDGTHAAPLRSSTAVTRAPGTPPRVQVPAAVIKWGAIAALALVAIVIGTWLGTRGSSSQEQPPLQTVEVKPPPSAGVAPPPPKPSPPPVTTAQTTPTAAVVPASSPAPPPAAPPPAPASEPASIVVPRVAWTNAMTVRLDRGAPLALTQQRTFSDLEPGAYTLNFHLEIAGYVKDESRRVELGSGERKQVSSPIAQPGLLTVRAKPARPQGEVLIDGKSLGPSPFSKRPLAPGAHQVEIRPTAGDSAPITQTVTVAAGKEAILSFDLQAAADRLNVHVKDAGPLPNP